jgi:hypothetical protein
MRPGQDMANAAAESGRAIGSVIGEAIRSELERQKAELARLREENKRLAHALKQFVDYYDQAGIGDCEEGHDDDDDDDCFDGDERFNVRHARAALRTAQESEGSK